MELGILIGLAGLLSGGFGLWRSRLSDERAKEHRDRLESTVGALPDLIAANVQRALPAASSHSPQGPYRARVDYVDITGDGREELCVQHPAGMQNSLLTVYGWRDHEFAELDTLSVDTPGGFKFEDFDGDGQIEVRGEEVDRDSDEARVSAPRIPVYFRWDNRSESFMRIENSDRDSRA